MGESEQLIITEIFHSIQGESTWAGVPCTFVRLARCHLRCTWCDTTYSFTGGDRMSLEAVLQEVESANLPIVEVTGGEPLLQPMVYPLMDALLERGRPVLLETSGAVVLDKVPEAVHKIMDLKPPGSGEVERNEYANIDLLKPHDEVKFVLADRADYEWSRDITLSNSLTQKVKAVTFSPVHGKLDPVDLSAWLIDDQLDVRLGMQLHKFIWPEATQGV